MLPIFWLESADSDLDEITDYIGQYDIGAAERMWHLLRSSVLPLSEHPYLYRQSDRVPGLREVVAHPNYIVLYRVAADRIEVVNVVHARRQFPGPSSFGENLAQSTREARDNTQDKAKPHLPHDH